MREEDVMLLGINRMNPTQVSVQVLRPRASRALVNALLKSFSDRSCLFPHR